jgi:ubiquitin carboxyl-terminal hydrolase L5
VYHFIAYIPFKGRVYEIDGLQDGPILLGETSPEVDWIAVAREAVMKRIAMYDYLMIA